MNESMHVIVDQEPGSPSPEVQVIATVSTFERIGLELAAFLHSSEVSLMVPAAGPSPDYPEAPFLDAVLFIKRDGPLLVVRTGERTLEISGSVEALERYARSFRFGPDGGHHHPEQGFREEDIDHASEMIVLEAIPDDE
jgi:hypothetical protein